jgi:hypothetical protein
MVRNAAYGMRYIIWTTKEAKSEARRKKKIFHASHGLHLAFCHLSSVVSPEIIGTRAFINKQG